MANAKHIIESKFEDFEDQFLDPDVIEAIKAEAAAASHRLTELLGTKVIATVDQIEKRTKISLTAHTASRRIFLSSLNIGHDRYAQGVTVSCFYVTFQNDDKWDIKHFDDPHEVSAAVGFMEIAAAKGYYLNQDRIL